MPGAGAGAAPDTGSALVPRLALGVTYLTPALGLRHRSPRPSGVLESWFTLQRRACKVTPNPLREGRGWTGSVSPPAHSASGAPQK